MDVLDAGLRLSRQTRSVEVGDVVVLAVEEAIDPEVRRFESRYSDYREVDGVLFSFLTEKFDLDTGERVQLDTVHSIVVNEIDDRSAFRMPE